MDIINQYLASPEFAEAMGNILLGIIIGLICRIAYALDPHAERDQPQSIDSPERRRRVELRARTLHAATN